MQCFDVFQSFIDNIIERKTEFESELIRSENYLNMLIKNCFPASINYDFNQGKRIRSILYYCFFNNQKNTTSANYQLIALVEAIHFVSLIHDDIVDNNKKRRGIPTLLNKYGMKISILLGDYMFTKIYAELKKLNYDNFIQTQFLKACNAMAYGALLEQFLNEDPSIEQYLKISYLKTAALFKLACLLGAYTSGALFNETKKAATFGICFGIIFQAQNDLDCYKFDKFEDSEDYVQKNITLPVIILKNYMNFKITRFFTSTQNGYSEIQKLLNSQQFNEIVKKVFSRYVNILSKNKL